MTTLTDGVSESAADLPEERPGGLREFAGRYAPPVLVYAGVKLLGLLVFFKLLAYSGTYLKNNPRFGGGQHVWDVLGSWDGWWYVQVAEKGYHPALVPLPGNGVFTMEQNSVAFFPLYPALMRIVSSVTGLGSYGAGMLVSVLASLVAAAGIYALTDRLYGRRAGILAAGLWAVFPGAGVAWSLYSESLFTAFAAWACWAVVTRRWTAAGLLTLFAGLTRPSASVLVVAVCAAALVALYRRDDGLRPLSGLLLAPVGFVGYLAWASWKLGSVTGYFTLQERAWAHKVDWGYNLFRAVRGLGLGRYDYLFPYPIEDLIALAVTLALPFLLLAYFRLRPPLVLTVYTLLTLAQIYLSLQMMGTVNRFLLPVFPLLLPLALALRKLPRAQQAAVLVLLGALSGWYASYALFNLGIP